MNRTYFYVALGALVIVMLSCSNNSEKQSKVSKIKELESILYSDTMTYLIDNNVAGELIDLYAEYSDIYMKDSLAPDYLFKAGEICRALNDGEEAILYYDKIISQYPDYDKAPYCLFLKAFVYENIIQNLINAKKCYTEFVEKHPDHDFADDAKILIENLGKSPEELIRSFEEKQIADPDSTTQEFE